MTVEPSQTPAVDEDEVRRCTALLEAVLEDPGVLARVPSDARRALLSAAGRVARPDRLEQAKGAAGFRRHKNRLQEEADRKVRATAQIRVARSAEVFAAPRLIEAEPAAENAPRLGKRQFCYVCKAEYRELHAFYASMCKPCAELNYAKRFQTARLDGRVALVTGGRVKIGFQTALKVLRAGARTIVTTRFPRDAALRFAREGDFAEWGHRLQIHGLDLRHAPSVEILARYLAGSLDRLDLLINNACQTVRRPPGFYTHLLAIEEGALAALPEAARALVSDHEACKSALRGGHHPVEQGAYSENVEQVEQVGAVAGTEPTGLAAWHGGRAGLGVLASARLSQVPYAYDDALAARDVFPEGRLDADLQQVDLRVQNSWRLKLAEVATPELLEVHLVNAIAPFILCAKLKPLMEKDPTGEKHVVNVSAMEGKFTRGTKTDRHPHTNMAKAALNMMTLTSAPDYAKDGIWMNAVDTGWVTDEDPALHAARKAQDLDFQPPLDIVDGAARVCDPFFAGLIAGVHPWGKFFKDYAPTDW